MKVMFFYLCCTLCSKTIWSTKLLPKKMQYMVAILKWWQSNVNITLWVSIDR